jgi:hypothetical protein
MVRGLNAGRGKRYSLLQNRPYRLWVPRSLIFHEYWGSFLGAKRQGREVENPPPSAEAKNEWSYTSAPLICLRGVDRDKVFVLFS